VDGQPRRRSGDRERRRWHDGSLDALQREVEDLRSEVRSRLDRYWSELQDLRRKLDSIDADCERDAREVRARIERLVEHVGLAAAQPQRNTANWREFFTYLFISIGGLGATIAGILLAAHG